MNKMFRSHSLCRRHCTYFSIFCILSCCRTYHIIENVHKKKTNHCQQPTGNKAKRSKEMKTNAYVLQTVDASIVLPLYASLLSIYRKPTDAGKFIPYEFRDDTMSMNAKNIRNKLIQTSVQKSLLFYLKKLKCSTTISNI